MKQQYPNGRYGLRLTSANRTTLQEALTSWPARGHDRFSPIYEREQANGAPLFIVYASLQNMNARLHEHIEMLSSLVGYCLWSEAVTHNVYGVARPVPFREERAPLLPTEEEWREIEAHVELLRDAVGDIAERRRNGESAWIDETEYRTCTCGYVAHDIPDMVAHEHRACPRSTDRSA